MTESYRECENISESSGGTVTPGIRTLTSVKLDDATVSVGGTTALTAYDQDHKEMNGTSGVVFSTYHPDIATIDAVTGAITGVKAGVVTMTATQGSVVLSKDLLVQV